MTDSGRDLSVSDDGTIVYRSPNVALSTLTWFDRDGRRSGTVGEPAPYTQLVLSPRGGHAAVTRGDAQGNNLDLWDADLATGIFSRLTTQPGDDSDPAWSPDERKLAFTTTCTGRRAIFVKDLTSGKEEPLVPFDQPAVVDEWTRDGRFVIFRTLGKAVYAMATSDDRTPRMLVDTPYIEDELHVSPDGRWVVFNADESGRWEVYLAAFPTFTSKRQISNGGGVQPQWRADGREVFYLAPNGTMMSVHVDPRGQLTVTPPSPLFRTKFAADPWVSQYAATGDGRRFLGLERVGAGTGFTFLINGLNAKLRAGAKQGGSN